MQLLTFLALNNTSVNSDTSETVLRVLTLNDTSIIMTLLVPVDSGDPSDNSDTRDAGNSSNTTNVTIITLLVLVDSIVTLLTIVPL